MIRTVEATIDPRGYVRLLEVVQVTATRRALVTILDNEPTAGLSETALLSERALAEASLAVLFEQTAREGLEAYPCQYGCHGWHLGHMSERSRRSG